MNISQLGVVLFLHIAVVVVSFMVAAVLHASLHAMPRAKTVAELRPFAAFVHRLEPVLPILALFILGFGSWLIHIEHRTFHDGWILTSLIALVVIEGLAGSTLAPRTKKLVAMINEAPDGEVSDALRKETLDPMIWDIFHITTLGFLGVVFVMADKPGGGIAVVIVVAAALVGVALSRFQLAAIKLDGASAALEP